jgi:parallel beta-helix repeat protein
VTFTSADDQVPWGGINFTGVEANGSRLENCTIQHAGGISDACHSPGAIIITQSSPIITGCTINQSAAVYGIRMDGATPVITNNIIAGFTSAGIALEASNWCPTHSYSSPTVTGNTITGNSTGIKLSYQASGTYTGNAFTGNNDGINVTYNANPLISGNSYTNNSDADLVVGGTINSATAWNETGNVVYKTGGINIAHV